MSGGFCLRFSATPSHVRHPERIELTGTLETEK